MTTPTSKKPLTYYRGGTPIAVIDEVKRASDGAECARLDALPAKLNALEAKLALRPELQTVEVQQELKWARQEAEVGNKNRRSKFLAQYCESCERHIRRIEDVLNNMSTLHSHASKLGTNLDVVRRMLATARPAFAASLSEELATATSKVRRIVDLLKMPSASYAIIYEELRPEARRVAKMHAAIVEHSKDVNIAREAKATAIAQLDNQEKLYASACSDLEDFVGWYDSIITKVRRTHNKTRMH